MIISLTFFVFGTANTTVHFYTIMTTLLIEQYMSHCTWMSVSDSCFGPPPFHSQPIARRHTCDVKFSRIRSLYVTPSLKKVSSGYIENEILWSRNMQWMYQEYRRKIAFLIMIFVLINISSASEDHRWAFSPKLL